MADGVLPALVVVPEEWEHGLNLTDDLKPRAASKYCKPGSGQGSAAPPPQPGVGAPVRGPQHLRA